MKKFLFILIIFIFPFFVRAEEKSAKVIPIVPRCVYVSGKEIIIPIEVISQNEGIIDNRLDKYLLDKVVNNGKSIRIRNISEKNYRIEIDGLKDGNDYSNVYFVLKENSNNKHYKNFDKVISFEVEFQVLEIPSKLYVLGTEVLLSKDKNLCKKINNYNSKDLNDKAIVLNDSNYIYLMIIGMLVIIIMVLLKRSDKNAIYKN